MNNKERAVEVSMTSHPADLPKVVKGAGINLVGAVSRTILLYAYTLFLARVLAPKQLGNYFLIFTIVNISGAVAAAGLDLGIVRYVALYAGEKKYNLVRKSFFAGLWMGIPISLVFTIAIIVAAPRISSIFLDGSKSSATALQIFALTIPFWVAARLLNALTQGLHMMQYQVYSRDMGEQFSKLVFSVIALVAGGGLIGIIWANMSSVVLAMGMSLTFVFMVLPKRTSYEFSGGNPGMQLFRFSLPLALSNVIGMALLWIDMLMIGYLGTSSDAGYYGTAMRVGTGSAVIMTALATVFSPVISDLYHKREFSELNSLYKTVSRWAFSLSLPFFLIVALLAGPALRLFGSNFSTVASGALILLALSQLVNAGTGVAGLLVLMSGHSRMELINVTVSLAIDISLCFLLIPSLGIIGAALANLASASVINLMRTVEAWLFVRMHAYNLNYIKPVFAGMVSSLAVLIEGRIVGPDASLLLSLMLPSVLFAVFYISMIFALGLDVHDKVIIDQLKNRFARADAGSGF